MRTGLVTYTDITAIVGDIIKVRVPLPEDGKDPIVRFGDLAEIKDSQGHSSIGQTIEIDSDLVSLQVFAGGKGLSNDVSVSFLGHPMQAVTSDAVLGRRLSGRGAPIDGGPSLEHESKSEIAGPSANPVRRVVPSNVVRTGIPMIDVYNTLVESQKIPIFSVAGEPYNMLLAKIAAGTDADVVVFGGMGLIYDDYHFFKESLGKSGAASKAVMFVHQSSDPVIECLLVPDMALAVAEKFAVQEGKKVLVLLTDMTAYADALKEVGVAMEKIPSNRGYMGDLYSQLARRYEKACDFKGAGSVTIITVTTMPGNDVTHPIPDNTGYITEGQFYLHDGVIDPFGSLSRLKQFVVGTKTREDHPKIMDAMVRYYSEAREAAQKKAMSFELSAFDHKLLKFGDLFKARFMDVNVSMPLEEALDMCWQTLAESFEKEDVILKRDLIEKYWPTPAQYKKAA